jgi:hypothetical protein
LNLCDISSTFQLTEKDRVRVVAGIQLRGAMLALCASAFAALLPAGQLPRLAGPCGRSLCECPVALVAPASDCSMPCHATAPQVLTLSGELLSAGSPGIAFQTITPNLEAPSQSIIPVDPTVAAVPLPSDGVNLLVSIARDIPTPPPRG